MNPTARGQQLTVQWDALNEFGSIKEKLLGALEPLKKFGRLEVDEGHVKFGLNATHMIRVFPTHLQLSISTSTPDESWAYEFVERCLTILQPKWVDFLASFQHLLPIDHTYESAREISLQTLFPWSEGLSMDDFALLLTGSWTDSGSENGLFHLEFGVVSEQEVPARVRGSVGRNQLAPLRVTEEWDFGEIPDVAWFMDSAWRMNLAYLPQGREEGDSSSTTQVLSLWKTARDSGERALKQFNQTAFAGPAQEE